MLFNSMTEDGKCWCLLKADLERFKERLRDGLPVVLHMDDGYEDIEVDATLEFDNLWLGVPDWSTIRYLPPT